MFSFRENCMLAFEGTLTTLHLFAAQNKARAYALFEAPRISATLSNFLLSGLTGNPSQGVIPRARSLNSGGKLCGWPARNLGSASSTKVMLPGISAKGYASENGSHAWRSIDYRSRPHRDGFNQPGLLHNQVSGMRQSERVLLRIPIEVEGIGPDGRVFRERTFTLVINRDGAQISLRAPLRSGYGIFVTNQQNKLAFPFRVVRQVEKPLDGGPEWGVECLEPESNFWGISFPEKRGAPTKQELIDALLECSKCHSRELAQLTTEGYRILIAQSLLGRKCAKCGTTTDWSFGFHEGGPSEMASVAAKQRRFKRFTVKMPVRIRLQDRQEEFTETQNLSKLGACFLSNLLMDELNPVLLSLGHGLGAHQKEMEARVVWRRQIEGVSRSLYGLELHERAVDGRASATPPILLQSLVGERA